MRKLFLVLCLASAASAWSQSYTIQTVPNVKVESNNFVSNPDGILDQSTVRRMDKQLRDLEEKTTAQVAVVALSSIGDQDIFTFAQELFTLWGIGQASTDNGLLILLVLDQRTVRIHTGQGLEGIFPDVVCKRIEVEYMVPEFKEGRNSEGMRAGVDQVVKILSDPVYAKELYTQTSRENGWDIFFRTIAVLGAVAMIIAYSLRKFAKANDKDSTPYAGMRLTKVMWIVEFAAIPMSILLVFQFSPMANPILESIAALYVYFLVTLVHKRLRMRAAERSLLEMKKYKRLVDFFQAYRVEWMVWGIVYPIPFLIHYFLYRRKIPYYRNHARDCRNCGKPTTKLDEQKDNSYLTKEKVFEEGLDSADYDVWLCDSCGTYFELAYRNRASKFSACPECKTRAYYLKGNRTLVNPTKNSKGKGEETHECKFCGHLVVSTYVIERISSGSSSSSSGSSGGSFGGGSSGGGGASSSW